MTNIIIGQFDPQTWFDNVTMDGTRLDPKPSQRVSNHSPDGFAWGYEGSGPAQLALAILLQAGVPKDDALPLHQSFKREFIAPLPRSSFRLQVDVLTWAASKGGSR